MNEPTAQGLPSFQWTPQPGWQLPQRTGRGDEGDVRGPGSGPSRSCHSCLEACPSEGNASSPPLSRPPVTGGPRPGLFAGRRSSPTTTPWPPRFPSRAGQKEGRRAVWEPDPLSRSGYAHSLLSRVFEQGQDRVRRSASPKEGDQSVETLGDQVLLQARDSSQVLAFQVEPGAAEAWLALYRHAWLAGERWLLPPEQPKRKKRSEDRST